MATTWGASGTTWGQNQWGDQEAVDVTLTAPTQLSTTLGTVIPFNELGWGSDTYGVENWGASGLVVSISGVSATTAVGTPSVVFYPGYGTLDWGENGWGSVDAAQYTLTGLSLTSAVGTIAPADVMGLTGLALTTAVGALAPKIDNTTTLTGVSATASVGAIILEIGIPISGLAATTALGSPVARGDYTESLTGLSALGAVGDLTVTSNPTVQPTGLSLTSAVGSLAPADVMGLTGLSLTSTVGAISPEDVMGLTGLSATVSVGNVAPLGYKDITATQSAGYSNVTATQSASYSDVNSV